MTNHLQISENDLIETICAEQDSWDGYLLSEPITVLLDSGVGQPLGTHEKRFLLYSSTGAEGAIRIRFHEHIGQLFVYIRTPKPALCKEIQKVLWKVFYETDINRLQALVPASCSQMASLYQDLGFKQEGVLRQHVRVGDNYEDVLLFSLLREDIPC